MKQLTLLSAFLTLFSLSLRATTKTIDIKIALEEAKTIRTIIVTGYNDSMMFYRLKNSAAILKIDCKSKKYSEQFRSDLIEKKKMKKTDLAGKWPEVGQEVLIVIGSNKLVSLFATRTGNDYRFWDPNSIPFVNSVFLITKEKSFRPLADCANSSTVKAYWICTDGCLVAVTDVKEKG